MKKSVLLLGLTILAVGAVATSELALGADMFNNIGKVAKATVKNFVFNGNFSKQETYNAYETSGDYKLVTNDQGDPIYTKFELTNLTRTPLYDDCGNYHFLYSCEERSTLTFEMTINNLQSFTAYYHFYYTKAHVANDSKFDGSIIFYSGSNEVKTNEFGLTYLDHLTVDQQYNVSLSNDTAYTVDKVVFVFNLYPRTTNGSETTRVYMEHIDVTWSC